MSSSSPSRRLPTPLALPGNGDAHADAAAVAAADARVLFEAGAADDVALAQGDEDQQAVVVRAVVQALAALLHRLVGHLRDLAGHGGVVVRGGETFHVAFAVAFGGGSSAIRRSLRSSLGCLATQHKRLRRARPAGRRSRFPLPRGSG